MKAKDKSKISLLLAIIAAISINITGVTCADIPQTTFADLPLRGETDEGITVPPDGNPDNDKNDCRQDQKTNDEDGLGTAKDAQYHLNELAKEGKTTVCP